MTLYLKSHLRCFSLADHIDTSMGMIVVAATVILIPPPLRRYDHPVDRQLIQCCGAQLV